MKIKWVAAYCFFALGAKAAEAQVSLEYNYVFVSEQVGYDCRNDNKQSGLNKIGAEQVMASKDGQCSDLTDQTLSGDLLGINLNGAILVGTTLSGADAGNSYFRGAKISHAKFVKTNLAGAMMNGAKIDNTDFSGSMMAGASLMMIKPLSDSNFTGADLTLVNFDQSVMENVEFNKAVFNNTLLMGADFSGAKLDEADLRGAVYSEATRLPFSHEVAKARGMRMRVPIDIHEHDHGQDLNPTIPFGSVNDLRWNTLSELRALER